MSEQKNQCFNCGYIHESEMAYYSSTYACYWSRKPMFAIYWCYNCTKVVIYEQAKMLGFIKVPSVVPKEVISLTEFPSKSKYASYKDYQSGFVHMHILRQIWYCFLARTKDHEGNYNHEIAFKDMMTKLNSPDVAALSKVLLHIHEIIDRVRSIQEGIFLPKFYHESEILDWISNFEDKRKAEEVKNIFAEFNKTSN